MGSVVLCVCMCVCVCVCMNKPNELLQIYRICNTSEQEKTNMSVIYFGTRLHAVIGNLQSVFFGRINRLCHFVWQKTRN